MMSIDMDTQATYIYPYTKATENPTHYRTSSIYGAQQ